MKTCISWTKVCTNVNFHDHEEVLTIIVSDLWLLNDLMWPLGLLTQCMRILKMKFVIIKKRRAFSKIPLWRHQLLTWLNRKLTWTPSFCYYKNLSLVIIIFLLLLLLLPRDCPVTKTCFPSSHNLQTSHIVRSALVDETCAVTSWWGHQISNYDKSMFNS